jgi:hypothetical protein
MNRRYDSSLHGAWLENAKMVTHSRANQPGFPNQFQYVEYQKNRHPTNENMEYNTSYVNEEVDIEQVRRDRGIIGEYQAMVPDLPFNQKYDEDIKSRMALLGFGALILGGFLVA